MSATSHSSNQSLAGLSSKVDESAAQPVDRSKEEDNIPPLSELQQEEERLRQQEEAELRLKREAAIKLASERGLSISEVHPNGTGSETPKRQSLHTRNSEDSQSPKAANTDEVETNPSSEPAIANGLTNGAPNEATSESEESDFVPARLPRF
jgi:hypothetical protein